jgi:hypothetical protein
MQDNIDYPVLFPHSPQKRSQLAVKQIKKESAIKPTPSESGRVLTTAQLDKQIVNLGC